MKEHRKGYCMKKFWQNLKSIPMGYKVCYFLTFIIYIVCYVFFFKNLLYLEDIETLMRYVVLFFFGVFGLFYMFVCYKKIKQRKKGLFIFRIDIWNTILFLYAGRKRTG